MDLSNTQLAIVCFTYAAILAVAFITICGPRRRA